MKNKLLTLLFALFIFGIPRSAHAVTYDYNTTSNWNLRIDGAATTDRLTRYSLEAVDVNGNGKDDLLIGAAGTDNNSRNASGSIYILYDSLLNSYLTTGNTIDLNSSTSYNIRIDGPAANGGITNVKVRDINNDGSMDLAISGDQTDFNSRSDSGSVYILYSSIFSGLTGTGNTIDLNSSSKYNLRIDGAAASDYLGTYINFADIDQNSKPDLFVTAYNRNSAEGSMYLIKDSILDDYTSTGNTIELATTTNFNVRWDGGTTGIYLGLMSNGIVFGDFDNDGKQDVVMGAEYTSPNSRSSSGSVWVVFNTLLDDNVGTGNVVNISTAANYNVRIDGSVAEAYLTFDAAGKFNQSGRDNLLLHEYATTGPSYVVANAKLASYAGSTGNNLDLATSTNYAVKVLGATGDYPGILGLQDFTNDGYNDLVVWASEADNNSRADSGSQYVVSGALLDGYLSSTGNSLSMASSSNYIYRLDGAVAGDFLPYKYASGDFNGDGVNDLAVSSQESDYNSRNNSGSVWLTYNFPHSLTNVTTSQGTDSLQIMGTVSATNSITSISGVQYRLDSNSPTSGWSNCTANDGSFNSTTEAFTCNSGVVTQGTHTMYVRALDSNSVYTAQSRFYAKTFANGGGSSSTSSGTRAQIVPNAGGVFGSTGDSNTGSQRVFAIAQANTLTFDAFLSAKIMSPASFFPATAAGRKGSNAILAGGSILGVKSSAGTRWQVGNVQFICYKAYPATGTDKEAAKIIPSLQKKSSIVALSYSTEHLTPVGQPKKKYNPKLFTLATSADGKTWKLLPSSVVDTVNRTVAALDKPCGYYMIVGR